MSPAATTSSHPSILAPNPTTYHPTRDAAARALAALLGYDMAPGGVLRDKAGALVCRGWRRFAELASEDGRLLETLRGWRVRLCSICGEGPASHHGAELDPVGSNCHHGRGAGAAAARWAAPTDTTTIDETPTAAPGTPTTTTDPTPYPEIADKARRMVDETPAPGAAPTLPEAPPPTAPRSTLARPVADPQHQPARRPHGHGRRAYQRGNGWDLLHGGAHPADGAH